MDLKFFVLNYSPVTFSKLEAGILRVQETNKNGGIFNGTKGDHIQTFCGLHTHYLQGKGEWGGHNMFLQILIDLRSKS